ncbi:MAG: hypothetical protein QOF83_1382 [Solirubrobacteraceae bacterium]|jgi:hypothetical protein|nr:hypothetical protein [Solirubrobacteraceae bacterium]
MLGSAELAGQAPVAGRKPLAEIEGFVDDLSLDGQHKSARWLLAWSLATTSLIPTSRAKRMPGPVRLSPRYETGGRPKLSTAGQEVSGRCRACW